VLVKSDGEYTYFAVDIAYHRKKVNRDFNTLYTVLGADHHGYVKRLEAAVKVCAEEIKKDIELKVIIGQLVSLYRDGEPVRMSKRTGDMVTLEEVMEEIGVDAARYFLVMRKADTAFDFDLEAAKKKSDENPVFYVQYAHARITGILRNLTEEPGTVPEKVIDSEEARDLALALIKFPEIVAEAGISLEPHRIPTYLESVARAFHYFYNHHRVITEDKEATRKRTQLIFAAKRVINNGLALIGVSSPERM
jgi:arginyl-tRNA synthetase